MNLAYINEERSLALRVSAEDDGMNIKEFLRRRLFFSSSLIKRVKYGGVLIEGKAVTMRAKIRSGDNIKITFPEENSENIQPISEPIKVVFEDEHILVVDKPKNMPIHPSRGNHLTTLANAVAAYFGAPSVFRAVNRLDRDTSGLVVIAKNPYSAARLYDEMKAGNFEKYYTAILTKPPTPPEGIINAPIRREADTEMKRIVAPDGKPAITEYRVTEILPDGRARCDLRLYTGRTHQIRVHMAHIGAPLFGDFLYGERRDEGYFLRASRIVFPHPVTNERMDIKI